MVSPVLYSVQYQNVAILHMITQLLINIEEQFLTQRNLFIRVQV